MENGRFEEFKERLKIYVVFLLFMFQVRGGKLQGWGLGITRSLLIGNVLCVPIRSKNSLEVLRDRLWIIEDDVVRKSLELGNLDSSLSWESLWDSGGRGGWTTSMPHGDCFLGAGPWPRAMAATVNTSLCISEPHLFLKVSKIWARTLGTRTLGLPTWSLIT